MLVQHRGIFDRRGAKLRRRVNSLLHFLTLLLLFATLPLSAGVGVGVGVGVAFFICLLLLRVCFVAGADLC